MDFTGTFSELNWWQNPSMSFWPYFSWPHGSPPFKEYRKNLTNFQLTSLFWKSVRLYFIECRLSIWINSLLYLFSCVWRAWLSHQELRHLQVPDSLSRQHPKSLQCGHLSSIQHLRLSSVFPLSLSSTPLNNSNMSSAASVSSSLWNFPNIQQTIYSSILHNIPIKRNHSPQLYSNLTKNIGHCV